MDRLKRINWNLAVDILILLVLVASVWPVKSVHAQLAASSGFAYNNITTAANIQVAPNPVTFHNLMINGGTLTGTITIVDTSAANCTGGQSIAVIAANQTAGQNYVYDIQTKNGLCFTTAQAVNATVSFR
jgi:hypothetical protein